MTSDRAHVAALQCSSHRSHFGSRYKLGCCGHAGLFCPRFNSPRRQSVGKQHTSTMRILHGHLMGQCRNSTETISKDYKCSIEAVYRQRRNNIETRKRHCSTTLETREKQRRNSAQTFWNQCTNISETRQKQYRNSIEALSEHYRNTPETI